MDEAMVMVWTFKGTSIDQFEFLLCIPGIEGLTYVGSLGVMCEYNV